MARTKQMPSRSTVRESLHDSGVPDPPRSHRRQPEQQSYDRQTPSRTTSSTDTAREPDAPSQGRSELQQQKKARKPYRYKPGTFALREIRKLQSTSELTIPFAPFVRLVKTLTNFYSTRVNRWSPEALIALQEAAESHVIELLGDAYLCSIHAKRVRLMVKYILLARRIGGRNFL